MSNKVVTFIKAHPYGTAAAVAAIVGLYILNHRGSAQTADAGVMQLGPDAASVQAANQLQIAQVQSQQASHVADLQAGVADKQLDVEAIMAQLKSNDTLAGYALQREVNLANIYTNRDIQINSNTLSAQTTQAVSLLQAQVQENRDAAQVEQTRINANAYVAIATAPRDDNSALLLAQQQAQQLAAQLNTANQQLGVYSQEITLVRQNLPTFDGGNLHLAGSAQDYQNLVATLH